MMGRIGASAGDRGIHDGHRGRMRAKLLRYGQEIFDTYELLEMLLYYTVPYKDTNPIAKKLLHVFGDLEGVLSASCEELVKVSGVGEKTAALISSVGRLDKILGTEKEAENNRFTDHCEVGKFIVSCFKETKEKKVIALYFDNSMNLLFLEDTYCGMDYDCGAITAKLFLDRAMKLGASAIITAHNHPYGPSYPTPGDRATNQLLRRELEKARVTLLEHYLVSGDRYTPLVDAFAKNSLRSEPIEDFIKSRMTADASDTAVDESALVYYNKKDAGYFSELLSYVVKEASGEVSEKLLKSFLTIENTVTVDVGRLSDLVGERCAVFLKLVAYLTSRRRTDRFVFKKRYTVSKLADYFKALFIGIPVENVYMMCMDSQGRATVCEKVGEGVVNSSDVLPRRLLEIAVKNSALRVALAHNHPFGNTSPSEDDLRTTAQIADLLESAGIRLSYHFVVSGQRCEAIEYDVSGERIFKMSAQ